MAFKIAQGLQRFFQPLAYTRDAAEGKGERVATIDECNSGKKPAGDKFCPFNYKDRFTQQNEKCNSNNNYGYELGTPCVLIKLNRVRIAPRPKYDHVATAIVFLFLRRSTPGSPPPTKNCPRTCHP